MLYNRRARRHNRRLRLNRILPQRAQLQALLRRAQSIVVVVLLAACSTLPASSTAIIKSPNDHREYRAVTLPNGLIAVLVSDPSTDKSAAALAVYRGSYDDPEGRAGLAHFLEHMLFLGTTKYPGVDEYQNFITTHGGTFNAYTSSDHTNYFFDIQTPFLEGGLDRFRAVLHCADVRCRLRGAGEERRQLRVSAVSERRRLAGQRGREAGDEPDASGCALLGGQPRHAERRRSHRPHRVLSHALFGRSDGARRARRSIARSARIVGNRKVLANSTPADCRARTDGADVRARYPAAKTHLSDGEGLAPGHLQLPGAEPRPVLPRKAGRVRRQPARPRRRRKPARAAEGARLDRVVGRERLALRC